MHTKITISNQTVSNFKISGETLSTILCRITPTLLYILTTESPNTQLCIVPKNMKCDNTMFSLIINIDENVVLTLINKGKENIYILNCSSTWLIIQKIINTLKTKSMCLGIINRRSICKDYPTFHKFMLIIHTLTCISSHLICDVSYTILCIFFESITDCANNVIYATYDDGSIVEQCSQFCGTVNFTLQRNNEFKTDIQKKVLHETTRLMKYGDIRYCSYSLSNNKFTANIIGVGTSRLDNILTSFSFVVVYENIETNTIEIIGYCKHKTVQNLDHFKLDVLKIMNSSMVSQSNVKAYVNKRYSLHMTKRVT